MTKANDAQTARKHVRTLSDALYVCLHAEKLTMRDYRQFGQALKAARKWFSSPAPQAPPAAGEGEENNE